MVPLQKTLPEHGRLGQDEGVNDARVAHPPWPQNEFLRWVLS